ncbi:sulfatase family protein [Sphingobium lactosutens]|uniref:sulfatase family protein n=1 Tax=Sphingobium lactosutens TaxID=522773 RepID=UPI00041C075F|nr:sulfatase-like hydrolase/transferase [Sphingobium lactosutens]
MPPFAGLDRRGVLKASAAATAALAASLASGRQARAAGGTKTKRPNIVFIMADDMGFADVSFNGQRDFTTPNIDAIAINGARFPSAYANSAVCSATRTALITGRYQYRLPLGLEEPLAGVSPPGIGLPPEMPTLPSLLRDAGYHTMLVGKWHLGELPKFGPLQSGYDHFFGFRGGALDYFSHHTRTGKPDLWDQDVPVEEAGYLTDLIGQHSVAAISEFSKTDKPFFISVHFNAPHWPWEGPDDEAESNRIKKTNLLHLDGGSKKTYQDMIQAMDRQVGAILDELKAKGLFDNTIVIFTSDNGGERFADVWPFSGQKTELLEGGLRVPTAMSWPAHIAKGQTCEQAMITMDWVPTLLAAAGTAPAKDYPSDGMDLLPVLTGAAHNLCRANYSGATRPIISGPCWTDIINISRSRKTPICSTWRTIRSSARTSRRASRNALRRWLLPGSPGTKPCCPKSMPASPKA